MNEPTQTHETTPAVGLGSSDLFGEGRAATPMTDAVVSDMKIRMEPIDYSLIRFARSLELGQAQLEKNCTQIYDAGRATEERLLATLRKAGAELTFWLEHAREADMHESARGALAVVKEIRALLPPNPAYQPVGGEASTESKSNERKS